MSIYIELSAAAEERLRRLMDKQGETDPARMVARALALFEATEPFMDESRLRVMRPTHPISSDLEKYVVEFRLPKPSVRTSAV